VIPSAPLLVTARLGLVPVRPDDADALHAQWNDAEVGRYLWDGQPVSRETVAAVVSASQTSFATLGFGLWALRGTGTSIAPSRDIVGFCGLRRPEGETDPELLFALDRSAWGAGFATESVAAVLKYAFAVLDLPRVTAAANPGNAASLRVLERAGLRRTGRVRTEIEELYTYEVRREEWPPHPSTPE
jgi:RimJ/RimL family protein N-acetyltransferase